MKKLIITKAYLVIFILLSAPVALSSNMGGRQKEPVTPDDFIMAEEFLSEQFSEPQSDDILENIIVESIEQDLPPYIEALFKEVAVSFNREQRLRKHRLIL